MVKAQDLINQQKDREKIKYKTFAHIYSKIEKKINIASASNFYYIWYEIPEFLIGHPLYNYKECIICISNQLTESGFEVDAYEPNLLLIKWFPN
jgi:hypothetical protein